MELALRTSLFVYAFVMVFLIVSYSPRLVCWTYARHKQKRLKNSKQNRIALIIPARNESAAISPLLESIKAQTYPGDRFNTHIIVADPKDKTLDMAKEIGAYTYIFEDQKCKGDALDYCLKEILKNSSDYYDAYIIIDADCILDKNFCEEMNNALSSNSDIITSKKLVKNYYYGDKSARTISACCNGIIWTLIDNMGNCYKSEHDLPVFTVGCGLLLRANVIKSMGGWKYRQTVTEDMELLNDAVAKGYKMSYYQYAVLYMEEARELEVTNKRRKRWMTGVIDSARIYSDDIAQCKNEHPDAVYHIKSLNKVYAMMGISSLFALVNMNTAILFIILRNSSFYNAAVNALIALGFIYTSFFVMTLIALIADYEHIKLPFYKKMLLLFTHPIFYMKYIEIVFVAVFTKKGRKWDAIERVDFGKDSTCGMQADIDINEEKSTDVERG